MGTGGSGTGGMGTGGSGTGGMGTGGSGTGGMGTGGSGTGGMGQGGAGGAMGTDCVIDTDCDDTYACTVDTCSNGYCSNTVDDSFCNDGAYCNGVELCEPQFGDPTTGCVNLGNPCDDGVGCTMDSCDEALDQCTQTPNDVMCDDGKFCSGDAFCDLTLGCQFTNIPNCDDGRSCTQDFCDSVSDACRNVPNDTVCGDGVFCNGAEVCSPTGPMGTGCIAGPPPNCSDGIACTDSVCDATLDACTHTPNDSLCDNNLICDGAETCSVAAGGCVAGTPLDCNDGKSCTIDTCSNTVAGGCVNTPNNNFCSNGLSCDGVETCNPAAPGANGATGCLEAPDVDCDDGYACTVDSCGEPGGSCTFTPTNSLCGPGNFCDPGNPADLDDDGCVDAQPCSTDAECDDLDDCNGIETCNSVCQPGMPVDCNDGVGCTIDVCNPAGGTCEHLPVDDVCDDGLQCNGVESCSETLDCVNGAPPSCNDGIACTDDFCQEGVGCASSPNNGFCSNGQFCDGVEQCAPGMAGANAQGCRAGVPVVCDDGVACTTDTCNETTDSCSSAPNNAACPCGQTCDPVNGCGSFCQVATCQGKVYACGNCIDDDNDCGIDSGDTQCLGPCQNNETGFYGDIPGQNSAPCKMDCYFDGDSGSGNDDCNWSHKCDPLSVAPNYDPSGSACEYSPNANIPGYQGSCADALSSQSAQCLNYCQPLAPNGCDCFGCCDIPGLTYSVYLGSNEGNPQCTLADLTDPDVCRPCTQVPSCINECEECEICLGKPTLPPQCTVQTCPAGKQLCGQPGQSACPSGEYCITGCCTAFPG
jgi:hypothetical protein